MESAREARTKTTIGKIHSLLMEKWAEYATRRVDFDRSAITTAFTNSKDRGWALADMRLLALRELMMLEMPDKWSDILLNSVPDTPRGQPRVLSAYPALRNTYLRRYFSIDFTNLPGSQQEKIDRVEANQGAECLYLIVMLATGDGEARTLFSEQDIGDVDEDGAPEFLDGWGRPIHYIRWPTGFVARSDLMLGDASSDHDSFDAFRRDQLNSFGPALGAYPSTVIATMVQELRDTTSAFRLVPLIYSAGSDGETDIDDLPYTGGAPPTTLNPYAVDPNTVGPVFVPTQPADPNFENFVLGLPTDKNQDGDDNSLDNIHNHLQDNR